MNRVETTVLNELQVIQKKAHTDYLTQLKNRHALEELIQDEQFDQAMLVLVDLDHLKLINDMYGHITGDTAICAMAEKIMAVFNAKSQHAFRLGGDEFLLVLTDSSHKQAYEQSRRLLEACQESVYCPIAERKLLLGASIGIAEYGKDKNDFWQAMTAADEMVYLAKKKGRNRIETTITQTIEQLPSITDEERAQLKQLQAQPLLIGCFDMLEEYEQFYRQFFTEYLGLNVTFEQIPQHHYEFTFFNKFDCLLHTLSTSHEQVTPFVHIPFEATPLIVVTHRTGQRFAIETAISKPIGIVKALFSEVEKTIMNSEYLYVYETLQDAVAAFQAHEVEGLIITRYFFKYVNRRQNSIPVYKQEMSNVTVGMAVQTGKPAQVLIPLIRKYLAAGGEAEFLKKTKSLQAIQTKVKTFLTADERAYLQQKSVARVHLHMHHGDFSRYNQQLGCYTGKAIELIESLQKLLEIDLQLPEPIFTQGKRMPTLEILECGQADLIFATRIPDVYAEDRYFEKYQLSLAFDYASTVVITLANRAKLSFSHIPQISVGFLADSYIGNYLTNFAIEPKRVQTYSDLASLVAALENHEIQALILSGDMGQELVRNKTFRIDFELPYHVERVLCARQKDHRLIEIMNKVLVCMYP